MPPLPFTLISLDLDLTFLDEHLRISPRNLQAVRRCRALGVRFVINSGRMHCTTLPYWRELELDTPVISYNGACIRYEDTGEELQHLRLDADTTREIVDFCDAEGLHLNYYRDDTLYIAKTDRWSDLYATRTSAELIPVGDLHRVLDRQPTKMLVVDAPERIAALYPRLRDRYAGRAYVTTSNCEYLEFIPLDADKGRALARVAMHYGVPREQVIAFGDARNDVPALRWAGMGVAVANACPEALAAAARTAPHHNADGVAVVLEEVFGLKPEQA